MKSTLMIAAMLLSDWATAQTVQMAVQRRYPCSRPSCEMVAQTEGLPFANLEKLDDVPAGCIKYAGTIYWVQECENSINCMSRECDMAGCEVIPEDTCAEEVQKESQGCGDEATKQGDWCVCQNGFMLNPSTLMNLGNLKRLKIKIGLNLDLEDLSESSLKLKMKMRFPYNVRNEPGFFCVPDMDYLDSENTKKCADEGETCECNGLVLFGAGNSWAEFFGNGFAMEPVTGSVMCSNAEFGDPVEGRSKKCYCITDTSPATPAPTPRPTPSPTPSPTDLVEQCSSHLMSHNFCEDWCNTPGKWDCGIVTLEASDPRNIYNVDYTCACNGCNGCPTDGRWPVRTPKPTPNPTPRPTPRPTPLPTPSPTPSPSPYPTPSPSPSPTPYPTPSPSPSPTPSPSPSPTPNPTPRPTPLPTPSPTPSPSPSPTPSPSPAPKPPTCPATAQANGPCEAIGMECKYGEECCCGECHPSSISTCTSGGWSMVMTEACYFFQTFDKCTDEQCSKITGRRKCEKVKGCSYVSGQCIAGGDNIIEPTPQPTTEVIVTPAPTQEAINPNDIATCYDAEVLRQCEAWGRFSKEDNGCRAFALGWKKQDNTCHGCSPTKRDYTACSKEECAAFCGDIYQTSAFEKKRCINGCNKYAELLAAKGHDPSKCLEDNGQGLLFDDDCLDCHYPPTQACSDGYLMSSRKRSLFSICTVITCSPPSQPTASTRRLQQQDILKRLRRLMEDEEEPDHPLLR